MLFLFIFELQLLFTKFHLELSAKLAIFSNLIRDRKEFIFERNISNVSPIHTVTSEASNLVFDENEFFRLQVHQHQFAIRSDEIQRIVLHLTKCDILLILKLYMRPNKFLVTTSIMDFTTFRTDLKEIIRIFCFFNRSNFFRSQNLKLDIIDISSKCRNRKCCQCNNHQHHTNKFLHSCPPFYNSTLKQILSNLFLLYHFFFLKSK